MSNCERPRLHTFGPELVIVVRGTPAPQGSKRHVGGGVMIESSKKLKPWRAAVADAARAVTAPWGPDWAPLDIPLRVRIVFTLRRPQRPTWPRPGRKPDIDKLARSSLDGLTGIIWVDDSRVVDLNLSKEYEQSGRAGALPECGAIITVREAIWP